MSERVVIFQAVHRESKRALSGEHFSQAPVTTVAKSRSRHMGPIDVVKRTYVLEATEVVRRCDEGKIA